LGIEGVGFLHAFLMCSKLFRSADMMCEYLTRNFNYCCSSDEMLKPRTSIQHDSISSDEQNDASLDVSTGSVSEETSAADSDSDSEREVQTRTRPEHHATQVCALCFSFI